MKAIQDSSSVVEKDGMLHFKNSKDINKTISRLNRLTKEEKNAWENQFASFSSLSKIYSDVVEAEWSISDYYENQANLGKQTPTDEVHSEIYKEALSNGSIKLIKDENGDYFDYNLYETQYAPVVNAQGLVVVGDSIYQYTLETLKIITNGNKSLITKLNDFSETSLNDNVVVIRYSSNSSNFAKTQSTYSWQYYCLPNNGWHYSGNSVRRWRVWIEGTSYLDGSFMYVTNNFRAQGQKKNFWGNWKFSETYCLEIDGTWSIANVILGDYTSVTLPLASGVQGSPIDYSSCYVNNATFPIYPHINGYYTSPGGSLERSFKYPAQVDGVNLSVVFGGVVMGIYY